MDSRTGDGVPCPRRPVRSTNHEIIMHRGKSRRAHRPGSVEALVPALDGVREHSTVTPPATRFQRSPWPWYVDAFWVLAYSFGFGPDAVRSIRGPTTWYSLTWYWFIVVGGALVAIWSGVSAYDKFRARRSRR